MKKYKFLVVITLLVVIICSNDGYGFSIHKPVSNQHGYDGSGYYSVSEFLKLSAKDFGELTGKKMNLWNRVSFKIVKLRMKHELKKHPGLQLRDFHLGSNSPFQRILFWILLGVLLLIGLFMLIFGLGPR